MPDRLSGTAPSASRTVLSLCRKMAVPATDPVVITWPQPCASAGDVPVVSMILDPPAGMTSLYSETPVVPATCSAQGIPNGCVNRKENGAGAEPAFTRIIVVSQSPPSAIWEIVAVVPAAGKLAISIGSIEASV